MRCLPVVAAGLLAGCLAGLDTGPGLVVRDGGEAVVTEGEYLRVAMPMDEPWRLEAMVTTEDDAAIDAYVLDQANLDLFDGRSPFEPTACVGEGTSAVLLACHLDGGTHYLIIDNSERGATSALDDLDGGVHVRWTVDGYA